MSRQTPFFNCPLNHDWWMYIIEDTILYAKAAPHDGDCLTDFSMRADYIIGLLDHLHVKYLRTCSQSGYMTAAMGLGSLVTPFLAPAGIGALAQQYRAGTRGVGFQKASIELSNHVVTFYPESGNENLSIINTRRVVTADVKERCGAFSSVENKLPTGAVPDRYAGGFKTGDRYRVQFRSGMVWTYILPNGEDYIDMEL